MESNPYSAPTADLSVANDDLISGNFQRFSAWWVFLLTFVTLGIYPVYWVYTRAQTVNRIQEDQIAPAWINLMAIGLVLSFVADFVFPEQGIVYLILYVTYLVTYVASLFKVKNRLNSLMSKSTGSNYELSPVMTFLFNSIYLQYKINEFIDNSQPQGEV
ncbi:DUF4234 domain-containing protein [Microbulbifer pacificus]|uniref:DUF4234 domain-containing protein n=1 Tax=Microbulbifer pacificus TaxID=407164 RepID=A0AAU0MZ78_9GAMM|nr:DUF4234 domain-containing protein [Microbulbifer pacificus]WOX05520.1 DUF4234 domain-containing protein [Microbulbifer pacificus]